MQSSRIEKTSVSGKSAVNSGELGLSLTVNSKVGFAFSLPVEESCIGKTGVCSKLCYGRGIRYRSSGQMKKQERNFRTVKFLLNLGGPKLLGENLVHLVDQARPGDYLAAKYSGASTFLPWAIRIQDLGDFMNSSYVEAWLYCVKSRPECRFWFYTRSFSLEDSLLRLASESNCQGFLSVDRDNYEVGLAMYERAPEVWGLAVLQEKPSEESAAFHRRIRELPRSAKVVNFPYHHGGRHVEVAPDLDCFTCPQVLGVYGLEADPSRPKPCQLCGYCLPP